MTRTMLEIFTETGDMAAYFEAKGWTVDTIGITGNVTIKKDVLVIPPEAIKHYDFVWSSPPCERYSKLSYIWPDQDRDRQAEAIHKKGIDLAMAADPQILMIENPVGKLRHAPFMREYYRYTINQSDYGLKYLKPTDIFSNYWPLYFKIPKQRGKDVFENSTKRLRSHYPGGLIKYVYELADKLI